MTSAKGKDFIFRRLKEMDASPKKSLGQNFLIEPNVIETILQQTKRRQGYDLVIEVGPGLGSLTEGLLKFYRDRLVLVELDRQFAQFWRSQGVVLFEQDALKISWSDLTEEKENVLLVSNLPYQISASLVIERSIGEENIKSMVLMFQKEVAQRITSEPHNKSYGILSVVSQLIWDIHVVVDAGPSCFYPAPKVMSRVLSFQRKDGVLSRDFLKFVKQSFSQRRKLLKKNLSAFKSEWTLQHILSAFEVLGLEEKVRAENVSPNEFLDLFHILNQSEQIREV